MQEFTDPGQLKSLIQDFLLIKSVELIEFSSRFEGRGVVLKLIIDKPQGGITVGECSELNRAISRLLDEQNLITQSYALEISSPGLDRPLVSKNDFFRCMNKPVHVFLKEMIDGKWEWEGTIAAVTETAVSLESGSRIRELPLTKINKAKQII